MSKFSRVVISIILASLFLSSESLFPAFAQVIGQKQTPLPRSKGEWVFYVKGRAFSSPVVANDRVYLGSENGILYVLGSLKGDLKWKYDTGYDTRCSVTVSGETVYLGLNNGVLQALNAFTGQIRWVYTGPTGEEYPLPPSIIYHFLSLPTVADGRIFYNTPDGKLHALDAATGEPKWVYDTKSPGVTPAAIAAGLVYVGSDNGNLYALDAATGRLKWSYLSIEAFFSPPVVDGGMVYAGSDNGNLYALDARKGELKWRYDTEGFFLSAPRFEKKVVYLSSNDGRMYALDAERGDPIWVYPTNGRLVTSATLGDEFGYLAATVEEKGVLQIAVFSFKKRGYPERKKVVYVRSRRQNPYSTWLVDYISGVAKETFSSSSRAGAISAINKVSTWPMTFFLRLAARPQLAQLSSPHLPRRQRMVTQTLLSLSPGAAASGFFYSFLSGPQVWGLTISFIFFGWLVLTLLYWGARVLPFGGVLGPKEESSSSGWREEINSLGKMFGRALQRTIQRYHLIALNFGVAIFVVLILGRLIGSVYPVQEIWAFFLLLLRLWMFALVVGSFVRGFVLSWVLLGPPAGTSPFSLALRGARKNFLRLLLISGGNGFTISLISFFLAIGQAYHLYSLITLVFVGVALLFLIQFADILVVSEDRSAIAAVWGSIRWMWARPVRMGGFLLFLGLILLLSSLLWLVFGGALGGLVFCLGIFSLISAYLVHLQAALYENSKIKM